MSKNERKDEAVLESLPELETLCRKCDGEGAGGGSRGQCVLCGGSGYELTEAGEQVLALMRHHFGPLLGEQVRGECG